MRSPSRVLLHATLCTRAYALLMSADSPSPGMEDDFPLLIHAVCGCVRIRACRIRAHALQIRPTLKSLCARIGVPQYAIRYTRIYAPFAHAPYPACGRNMCAHKRAHIGARPAGDQRALPQMVRAVRGDWPSLEPEAGASGPSRGRRHDRAKGDKSSFGPRDRRPPSVIPQAGPK
jgi:hypothetical protein